MKSLTQFVFEYRVKNEISIKCEQTKEEIDPDYVIYDKSSLDEFIQKYKNNKEVYDDKIFFFIEQKGNDWLAKTKTEYHIDVYRMTDKFLSSDKQSYSYDDLLSILENGDKMIIIVDKQ